MTGRVIEEVLRGSGPIAMPPGLLTPLPWPDWTARMRSLDVDGVRADYVEAAPHRLDVPAFRDRPDSPVRLMLAIILGGTSTGEVDGQPQTLTVKEAALIDGRAAMWVESPRPVRAMRLFVDEDHLPPEVRNRPRPPFARLKHTPLVTGCIGFISGLLQVGNPIVETRDEAAVSQPLIALQASLLDEALHQQELDGDGSGRASEASSRRERIEAHVEQHLADRDLSVPHIAAALGIAVRTVHAVFEGGPVTAAEYVRQRQLVRAQSILVTRQDPPNIAAVAERVGLSRDQLNRVFRADTGLTARQWWERHRGPADRRAAGRRG